MALARTWVLVALAAIELAGASHAADHASAELRVLAWNIWNGGDDHDDHQVHRSDDRKIALVGEFSTASGGQIWGGGLR